MHSLEILSFVRKGNSIDMKLSHGSSLHLSADIVTANYKGITIINNGDITCPMDDNRIAFYSKTTKTLSYPLPKGANESSIRAAALFADHRVDIPVSIDNGLIKVNVTKQVPTIVYLNDKTGK
jgi:hypothetical protein